MTLIPDQKKIKAIELATTIDQQLWESTSWLTRTRLQWRRQFLRYYWSVPPPWRVATRLLHPSKRAIPTFASLGAPRSGTTLLSDYIMQHPNVVLPLAKELELSYLTWRYWNAQFPTVREMRETERKFGKAITGYCAPAIPNSLLTYAISAFAKNLKIVILLRNPVERTYAHWRWQELQTKGLRRDPLWANYPDFPAAMDVELEAAQSCATSGLYPLGCGGFLQYSIYLPFLKQLFRFYDRDEALFINSADFFSDPVNVARRVYEFLELPAYDPVALPVRNAGPRGVMPEETRHKLANFFAPLNEELYEFVGCDFGWE